jgi:hypothetical protein
MGKLSPLTLNPVPDAVAEVSVIEEVLEWFAKIPLIVELLPTVTLPNVMLVGFTVRTTVVAGPFVP